MQRNFDAKQCILEEFKEIFKAFQAKHKVVAKKVSYSSRGFARCHRKIGNLLAMASHHSSTSLIGAKWET
jgi:hypothetical protein